MSSSRPRPAWDTFVEAHAGQQVSLRLFGALATIVRDLRHAHDQQLAELRREVQALQARPQLRYRNDWDPRTAYDIGDLVSHAGSVWHCQMPVTGVPPSLDGIAANGWRCFVKRGRTGKAAPGWNQREDDR